MTEMEEIDPVKRNEILQKVKKVDWNQIYSMPDLKIATGQPIDNITGLTNNGKFTSNQSNKNNAAIIIIVPCKIQELLYNMWKSEYNNKTLIEKYMTYCKILDRVIKLAKDKCDNEQTAIYCKDSKSLQQLRNKKTEKNKKGIKQEIPKIKVNGQ